MQSSIAFGLRGLAF